MDLVEWLRIPSISGSPRHRAAVGRAATWLARRLGRLTSDVEVRDTGLGPLVVARVPAAPGSALAPAIVIYGHLDVRPPGPGWTSPPFAPVRHGPRLVARGASDDKGQLMAHLVALEGWVRAGGPPVDVIVLGDGAEEIGSPGLAQVLRPRSRRDLLHGLVSTVVISDGREAHPGRPSLTVSQRGMLSLRFRVDTGGTPVHAGRFGGAVVDPNLVLASGLARAQQLIAPLRSPCPVEARPVPDVWVARHAGGRALVGLGLDERSTRRAALTVSSWRSSAAPGSIPTVAEASVDVRVPPGVNPRHTARMLASAMRSDPWELRGLSVHVGATAEGHCLHLGARHLDAVRAACLSGYGAAPRRVASGGSLPVVGSLARRFQAPVVLLGLGPVDDHAHGPDEYLDLPRWRCATDACTSLLAYLAAVGAEPGGGPLSSGSIAPRGAVMGVRARTNTAGFVPRSRRLQGALHGD